MESLSRVNVSNLLGSSNIGFVLARSNVELSVFDDREYRGVDRLPFVPDPFKQQSPDAEIWDAYLSAWEDGSLGRDLHFANELRDELAGLGISTEVIHADIEIPPPRVARLASTTEEAERARSLSWLRSRTADVPPPPPEFVSIGLDISTAAPTFHSVIAQPGLVGGDVDLAPRLNEAGLVDDPEFAVRLMKDANETGYLLGLFAVIRVFAPR
jgi:hypothetical protein